MNWSVEAKLLALLVTVLAVGTACGALLARSLPNVVLTTGLVTLLCFLPLLALTRRLVRPVRRLLRAMSVAVASYRDGDFTVSFAVTRTDELGELLAAHNELGRALREQHSQLTQRELLLETVAQNSSVAMVLVDDNQRVAYANLAARHLLGEGRSLTGQDFQVLLQRGPPALQAAVCAGEDSLFTAEVDGTEETFHQAAQALLLYGRPHKLHLLKRMTRELSRREVATWKNLIRVLSHELNNSLGPIASLAYSGATLVRRGEGGELAEIFAAIEERAEHLHHFLLGYAAFARLPAPRPAWADWERLITEIKRQQRCQICGALPAELGWFDQAQIAQALINLLKNGAEAGGLEDQLELAVIQTALEQRIEVRDRGPGMTENVMSQALLPFYSTKRSGTGLGLPLVREIAEAHGGRIELANREGGGLCATLILPRPATPISSAAEASGDDDQSIRR